MLMKLIAIFVLLSSVIVYFFPSYSLEIFILRRRRLILLRNACPNTTEFDNIGIRLDKLSYTFMGDTPTIFNYMLDQNK